MTTETYGVLLNSCYGSFGFPHEFVVKVFALFPPHTEIGARLFPQINSQRHIIGPSVQPAQSWTNYHVIQAVEPLTGSYQLVSADMFVRFGSGYHKFVEAEPFFATADMTTYYSLRDFNAYDWRTNAEILRLACTEGIIGKEHGSALLRVERVPIHCGFHIINDSGKEELVIDFPV
jgi:hypothetical protein